eukprot:519888-Rhodomonas_salina.1
MHGIEARVRVSLSHFCNIFGRYVAINGSIASINGSIASINGSIASINSSAATKNQSTATTEREKKARKRATAEKIQINHKPVQTVRRMRRNAFDCGWYLRDNGQRGVIDTCEALLLTYHPKPALAYVSTGQRVAAR